LNVSQIPSGPPAYRCLRRDERNLGTT